MSNSLIFETEPFEFSPPEPGEQSCHCAKCLAHRTRANASEDEAWEEIDFEEESYGAPSMQRPIARHVWPGLTWEKICWVQNVLNRAGGERLAVDGKAWPLFRAAVQRFQSANRLKVDGIVGPPTETAFIQAALNEIAKEALGRVAGAMDARTE